MLARLKQLNEEKIHVDALEACMYRIGFNALPFYFSVRSTRQSVIKACSKEIENLAASRDTLYQKKLNSGAIDLNAPNIEPDIRFGMIRVDIFMEEYAKQLSAMPRR